MVRIVRPLFSDTATGKIGGLGSFRRARSGTFHLINPPFPEKPGTCPDQVRADNLAEAKKAHAQIAKTKVFQGGKWRWLIIPTWPDYWAQWQIDHGLPVSERHAAASPTAGAALSSVADYIGDPGMAEDQQVNVTIDATASADVEEAAAPAQAAQLAISATAHFQNSAP